MIRKLKFDQDLFKNLWYELNPRVCCAFGNVYFNIKIPRSTFLRIVSFCLSYTQTNNFGASRNNSEENYLTSNL